MKKLILLLSLMLSAFLLISCPGTSPAGEDPGTGDPDENEAVIPSEFWGRWIGIGADSEWYISDAKVFRGEFEQTVTGADPASITMTNGKIYRDSVTDDVNTLRFASENFNATYDIPVYLYRLSGASSSFTASVVNSSLPAASISRAGGLAGLAGINTIIANVDNPSDYQTADTGAEGLLTVDEIILGDNYTITIPAGQAGLTADLSAEVTPLYDGQDLGIFDILNSGVNYKMNLRTNTWSRYLIADGATAYEVILDVTNMGQDMDMDQTKYWITPLNGLILDDSSENPEEDILGTVFADGGKVSKEFRFRCPPITSDYEDMELQVEVADIGRNRVWTEVLALRFYRQNLQFTVDLASSSSSVVGGVVLDPEGVPERLSEGENILNMKPGTWTLIMGNTGSGDECVYSLGVDAGGSMDFSGFSDLGIGENLSTGGNNTLAGALPLIPGEPVMHYMASTDVDFFTLTLSEENSLIYDENGADSGAVPAAVSGLDYGETVTLPDNPGLLQKDDCFFAGWGFYPGVLTSFDGSELPSSVAVKADPTRMYAQWVPAASSIDYPYIIRTDQTVWHLNYLGSQETPFMENAAEIITGEYRVFYIKTDGTLWAEGQNTEGQLGVGEAAYLGTPVEVPLDHSAVKVLALGETTYVLDDQNDLYGFGDNSVFDPDATEDYYSAPFFIRGDVSDFDIEYWTLYVLTTGDELWGMRSNSDGQLGDGTTTDRDDFVLIAEGVSSFSADIRTLHYILAADDSLWGTGQNAQGQIGDGTTSDVLSPVKVAENVEWVYSERNQTFFKMNDGSVKACGHNWSGCLGVGETSSAILTPSVVSAGAEIESLSILPADNNYDSTFFLLSDGRVAAAGENSDGQLGLGHTNDVSTPAAVTGLTDVVSISAGVFLTASGEIWAIQSADGYLAGRVYP